MFTEWCLGRDNTNTIITVSYNSVLAGEFSRYTRDGIQSQPKDLTDIVFNDIFPLTKIKSGDSSAQKWSLEGQHFNYSGVGTDSSLTGRGMKIGIIDDIIKNASEAFNEMELERHWKFYTGTYVSRLEKNSIQIICATRWVSGDLCGKILEVEREDWYQLTLPVYQDNKMLCDEILNLEGYLQLEKIMDPLIFESNYNCKCIDVQNRLYDIKVWTELPPKFQKIICVCDTADTGGDYTCAIVAGIINNQAFILDLIHDNRAMEYTEPLLVNMLIRNRVHECKIESNNGGRQFARNIERLLKEKSIYNINIKWFHQSQNKIARILSNAATVNRSIFLPLTWNNYKSFYKEILNYAREGKNLHDDGADAITQLAEYISKPLEKQIIYI
jgi:predicted phage terminase large subunit-like protein